ncbi:MAG TPA: transposase [Candidatus Fraserbacteria bacterium]|nr:transposase [Candidatus Fraserbacteria bacterium]
MARKAYPSDLTDGQWALIAPLLPAAKPGGRPRTVSLSEVLNAIFYLVRSGCSWRMLPHDLPPWGTVHYYYRCWRLDGTWGCRYDRLAPGGGSPHSRSPGSGGGETRLGAVSWALPYLCQHGSQGLPWLPPSAWD